MQEQLVLQTVELIDIHSKNLDFTAEAYKAVVQCTHRRPKAVMDTQSQGYLKAVQRGKRERIKMRRKRGGGKKKGQGGEGC